MRTDGPVFVGVIEDVQPGNLSPNMSTSHVRLAFEYTGEKWITASDVYPVRRSWTVIFNGRRIGSVESHADSPPSYYSDVGIETIIDQAGHIPRITNGASSFDYAGNRARTRPLLVVSAPHFRDPDEWKPALLSPAESRTAIAAFRTKVPSVGRCERPEEGPIRMAPYADNQIRLVKAYRSKSDEVLVGQQLTGDFSRCGFSDNPTLFSYWFVLERGAVRFLGMQLMPIDAADLAGTGSSEWIFLTSRGADSGGYELFYDDFSKRVSFDWTYH